MGTELRVVIVGAGQAGAAAAARLRAKGFDGPITLIGNEAYPPYQRPPLSKKYLSGEWEADRLFLRPAAFWEERKIRLVTGLDVEMIDLDRRDVIAGSDRIAWDRLVLATGTTPRRLPGAPPRLGGVFVLRGIADVDRMRPALVEGARLVVVGGGFIGLETAAVAVSAGLNVSVVEAAPRILQRVVCPQTADYFRALHLARGVALYEGQTVTGLREDVGKVGAVELSNGESLPADLVLVGIGVVPEMRLAAAAGLACDNGISVDAYGRTSAPNVWAAGDCASFPLDGRRVRLENVQNAIEQAELIADDILGAAAPYRPVPWFWSDQYDAKLQIAGLADDYDRVVSRSGTETMSNWYLKGRDLVAVDAINDARAFMTAKRLLASQAPIDVGRLSAPDFEPRSLLAS